jgi:hypothetical protein
MANAAHSAYYKALDDPWDTNTVCNMQFSVFFVCTNSCAIFSLGHVFLVDQMRCSFDQMQQVVNVSSPV